MKALYLPLLLLGAMLAFALWTGRFVQQRTDHWIAMLELADHLAVEERWEDAEDQIQRSYRDWRESQTFFHTILEHEELDEAEGLFAAAFAACDQRDVPDFHTTLAQLYTQLRLLAETQQVSIKNVL